MARSFKDAVNKMEKRSNAPAVEVPAGYILKEESKTRRVSIALKPSTFERLKDQAAAQGQSYNEFINTIIEAYLKDK